VKEKKCKNEVKNDVGPVAYLRIACSIFFSSLGLEGETIGQRNVEGRVSPGMRRETQRRGG